MYSSAFHSVNGQVLSPREIARALGGVQTAPDESRAVLNALEYAKTRFHSRLTTRPTPAPLPSLIGKAFKGIGRSCGDTAGSQCGAHAARLSCAGCGRFSGRRFLIRGATGDAAVEVAA